MSDETTQRVYDLLVQLSTTGLNAAKQLFWTELNYDRVNRPLSDRDWPDAARATLASQPLLLAGSESRLGAFDVIFVKLAAEGASWAFPLSLTAERQVIGQLFPHHPYALFLFTDPTEKYWHFVNVRYDKDVTRRRVFRRISIGPGERLRTASERISLLNLTALSPNLTGLSPLAIQQRHDEAFDVEPVTRKFFEEYRRVFSLVEVQVTGFISSERRRLFVQSLFNRLMFVAFIQKKGWLRYVGDSDYLSALWEAYLRERAVQRDYTGTEPNFYRDRLRLLFFAGLNTPNEVNVVEIRQGGTLEAVIGQVPYLNGGLFEEDADDQNPEVAVPDECIAAILDELFDRFNFTVMESTPLDIEVAVDPEMLGKVFEELVTGRHETGSYYTPKPVVSYMCREALKGYLVGHVPTESQGTLTAFVDEHDPAGLRDPEAVLEALRAVRACDPACGSGAYLLGMLHELLDLRTVLFAARRIDSISSYNRKLEIIQNNVYGVDIDPFAVNIARLRLWLSLAVDFQGDTPPPLPNLDFKIEIGDSLTGPDPSGGLQLGLRQPLIDDYFDLKKQYLMAHGSEKIGLHGRVLAQRNEIGAWVRPKGKAEGFDWAVEFAEVFSDGGFDVVVANPPYVHMGLIKDYKPILRVLYSDVYTGRADLYVYFYSRALQLVRPRGMVVFISSNKFMRAQYGEPLRQLIMAHTTLESLVDFGDLPLFEAAAYPAIIAISKQAPLESQAVRVLSVVDLGIVDHLSETVKQSGWLLPQSDLGKEGWSFVQPFLLQIIHKLRGTGTQLARYAQGQVFRGVVTGLNEAFVIDKATADAMISECPDSANVIRPWLRGRDIKRWHVNYQQLYIIFTFHGIDISRYPAILRHLAPFEQALRNRATSANHEWYELQQPQMGIYRFFDMPKIVYPNICKQPEFAFDNRGFYVNQKCFIIPQADLYLLGILNSEVTFFLFQQTLPKLRGDFYEPGSSFLERFPVPDLASPDRSAIVKIVEALLQAGASNRDVDRYETELNRAVYQAYGLDSDEAEIIHRSIATELVRSKLETATKALEALRDEQ